MEMLCWTAETTVHYKRLMFFKSCLWSSSFTCPCSPRSSDPGTRDGFVGRQTWPGASRYDPAQKIIIIDDDSPGADFSPGSPIVNIALCCNPIVLYILFCNFTMVFYY